jgi:cephalosporin-C deacetylase
MPSALFSQFLRTQDLRPKAGGDTSLRTFAAGDTPVTQTLMKAFLLPILSLATLSVAGASAPPSAMIKDTFLIRDGNIVFESDIWSARTSREAGYTSLKVGGHEFLHDSDHVGGFLFEGQKPAPGRPIFPDIQNISHDAMLGHLGLTADGLYMIRLSQDPASGAVELYFGANVEGPTNLRMFLNKDIVTIKTPDGTFVPGPDAPPLRSSSLTLVHRDGTELGIKSAGPGESQDPQALEIAMTEHPDGGKVPTLIFHGRGFAANSLSLSFGDSPHKTTGVGHPHFVVASSDDPHSNTEGATEGVLNPVYTPDTKLDFGMEFEWEGKEPFTGYAELEVVHALGKPHYYERVDLSGQGPGKITTKFHPKFHMPGVSEAWVRLVGAGGHMLWNDRYRMAYDIEAFQPAIQVEPDFKEFWDETLRQLREIPLDPKTVRAEPFKDFPGFEVYEVSFASWQGRRISAILYVPREGHRPFPAVMTAHPGIKGFSINRGPDGIFGSQIHLDPRVVTIVPLIRGHAPDAPDIPFNHPWWGPMENRDDYVARSWYCALVRSIDYLATRPDLVDMKRIIAPGGSQGGGFALVTAALDHRIAYCFADAPALGQPQEIMWHYGSFGPSRGQVPAGKTDADVERLMSYYNPVNFGPYIQCPTQIGSNIGDLTVHSMGPLACYKNLTGLQPSDKRFHPGFTHAHGSGPGLGQAQNEVIERLKNP